MFKTKSIKDVALHLLLIIITITLLILGFFYIYLPKTTNHGETLTVPDLEGMPFANVDEVLTERNMRYEVQADSSYSADYPPFTILKQYPAAGSKVKENRKISLSLNAANPPLVKMPRLEDGSVKNAQMVLESFGLVLGIDAFVRIDENGGAETIIIEVNSLPGMTPATCIFHQSAINGYKPYNFIDAIITYGMESKEAADAL